MTQYVLTTLQRKGYTVKPVGNLYKCKCPFHKDKEASFTIYPDTDSFYCYGCQSGGGPVQLLKLFKEPIPQEIYDATSDETAVKASDSDTDVKQKLLLQLGVKFQKTRTVYSTVLRSRRMRSWYKNQTVLNNRLVTLLTGRKDI